MTVNCLFVHCNKCFDVKKKEYQEGHRFVVWEGVKNTEPSLHHFKVLVSKSLKNRKQTKRKSEEEIKYLGVVFTRVEH